MKSYEVSLPQLGLIAATRGLAGAGLGMLVASRVPRRRRTTVGWTLFAVGALSTIPLMIQLARHKKAKPAEDTCATDARMPQRQSIGAEL